MKILSIEEAENMDQTGLITVEDYKNAGLIVPDAENLWILQKNYNVHDVELTDEIKEHLGEERSNDLYWFLSELWPYMETDMSEIPEKAEKILKQAVKERNDFADQPFNMEVKKWPGTMSFIILVDGIEAASYEFIVDYNEDVYNYEWHGERILPNDEFAGEVGENPDIGWEFFDQITAALKKIRAAA